jgi:hypothetical protein
VFSMTYELSHKTHLGAWEKSRNVAVGFVMSVRPSVRPSACSTWAPAGRIFVTFLLRILTNRMRKFAFRGDGTLRVKTDVLRGNVSLNSAGAEEISGIFLQKVSTSYVKYCFRK